MGSLNGAASGGRTGEKANGMFATSARAIASGTGSAGANGETASVFGSVIASDHNCAVTESANVTVHGRANGGMNVEVNDGVNDGVNGVVSASVIEHFAALPVVKVKHRMSFPRS